MSIEPATSLSYVPAILLRSSLGTLALLFIDRILPQDVHRNYYCHFATCDLCLGWNELAAISQSRVYHFGCQ